MKSHVTSWNKELDISSFQKVLQRNELHDYSSNCSRFPENILLHKLNISSSRIQGF